jgi:hypothetical protein
MQIAAEHSETVGEGSRIRVEEGLLFDRVTLHATNVSPGHVELSTTIEADFTDTRLAFGNGAGVTAGITPNAIAIEFLV